jgi:hypothetical protein
MKDFSGNIIILLSNFVPTDDPSISPECFFTLGKEGRPNQISILMPMPVLGKCMRRYQIFLNDHDAIVSNVDRVILTNRTFFGGPKDWCCEKTGDRCASYNEIAKLSDPIMKDFHEKLCEKITKDGGDYRVVLFGDHAWSACANWFPAKKVINRESIAHGSVIRNNWHRENARDDFLITVDRASAFSGAVPIPFMDSEKSDFLHIGNNPKKRKEVQRDPKKDAREEEMRARKKEEERARKKEERATREEVCAREEEDAALDLELLRIEKEMKAEKCAREVEERVRKQKEEQARKEKESVRWKEV